MRMATGSAGRSVLVTLVSVAAAVTAPSAAAAPTVSEAERIVFGERYHSVQHGGIVRAANSSITCREPVARGAGSCPSARRSAGVNGDFDMFYVDVDDDSNTYNSSRADLRMPEGAEVSWARLYWGGNLRVGEQKPPADNGRVLVAEPGGRYREVLADSVVGHRTTGSTDAFQASADVTDLVRGSGSGSWTVAQVNVARGHSAAGAWGGWTLVAAYEDEREPLRTLAVWDGFEALHAGRRSLGVSMDGLDVRPGAEGSLGLVGYNGDRGSTGDSLTVQADAGPAHRVRDAANPSDDLLNSTISAHGKHTGARSPAYANTLGYDSDVFDIKPALERGAERMNFRFSTRSEGYQTGVLFLQAEATD